MSNINYTYTKFKDFSDARNQSLRMNKERYCIWMDCDDVLQTPQATRDLILVNPHLSAFKTKVLSYTERNTVETIVHTRLFRNNPELKFVNRCHEDISYSINKLNYLHAFSDLTIQHFGYIKPKEWHAKNKRNLKLMKQDIKEIETNPKPSQDDVGRLSMLYYGIVNALILLAGPQKPKQKRITLIQALGYADACIPKLGDKDPLLAKMWMLRGMACMDAGAQLAAKQSFHKAYDEWQQPEAAINLSEIYLLEKNWNKAIEILDSVMDKYKGAYPFSGLSHDPVHIHSLLLEKLGHAWANKSQECRNNREAFDGYVRKAEEYYKECLNIRPKLEVVNILCQILRNTGRMDESAHITIKAINRWPKYFKGWCELAEYELMAGRKQTALVFSREALRLSPANKEVRQNIKVICLQKINKK